MNQLLYWTFVLSILSLRSQADHNNLIYNLNHGPMNMTDDCLYSSDTWYKTRNNEYQICNDGQYSCTMFSKKISIQSAQSLMINVSTTTRKGNITFRIRTGSEIIADGIIPVVDGPYHLQNISNFTVDVAANTSIQLEFVSKGYCGVITGINISSVGPNNCSGKFRCHNGPWCVPRHWVCDRYNDCGDYSDERNCTHFQTTVGPNDCPGKFRCHNGRRCIPRSWVCDRDNDCGDYSDERNCRHHTSPAPYTRAPRRRTTVNHEDISSGTCTTVSKTDCDIVANQRRRALPMENPTVPPGCYHDHVVNVVIYNDRLSSTQPCTELQVCICKKPYNEDVSSGNCTSVSKHDCDKVAKQRSDGAGGHSYKGGPPGCYMRQDYSVNYNYYLSSTQPCTERRVCICKKHSSKVGPTEAPTEAPTETPDYATHREVQSLKHKFMAMIWKVQKKLYDLGKTINRLHPELQKWIYYPIGTHDYRARREYPEYNATFVEIGWININRGSRGYHSRNTTVEECLDWCGTPWFNCTDVVLNLYNLYNPEHLTCYCMVHGYRGISAFSNGLHYRLH